MTRPTTAVSNYPLFKFFNFWGVVLVKMDKRLLKLFTCRKKKNWTLPLKFISLLLLGAKMPWLLKQKKEVHIFHKAEFVIYDELPPSTEVVLRQWTIRDVSEWICTSFSFLFSSIYI